MDSFGITRVNRLRKAAERAREGRDSKLFSLDRASFPRCDGWSVSLIDPTNLLKVFKTLWLKDGFALHGYEFTSGGNGNGVIWAVPSDAPVLTPEECPRLEDVFLEPPKPPGAVELMKAIEGEFYLWVKYPGYKFCCSFPTKTATKTLYNTGALYDKTWQMIDYSDSFKF